MTKPQTVTWVGDKLMTPEGTVIAEVSADIVEFGNERLLVESSLGTALSFRLRATSADGRVFTMRKESFTVARISASCEDRTYSLDRTNPWRKSRSICDASGTEVAKARALIGGTLVIEVLADIPTADFVFMAFGLLLVDVPSRNVRYA